MRVEKRRVLSQLKSRFCFFAGTPEAGRKIIQRMTAAGIPTNAGRLRIKDAAQRIAAAIRRMTVYTRGRTSVPSPRIFPRSLRKEKG